MAKLLLMKVYGMEALEDQFEKVDVEELSDYYKYLECDYFDIATRKIGEKYYDIFCDDEGMFREDAITSAIGPDGSTMLVGNLIFANHDGEGNTTSLTREDVVNIVNNAHVAIGDGNVLFRVVCEY